MGGVQKNALSTKIQENQRKTNSFQHREKKFNIQCHKPNSFYHFWGGEFLHLHKIVTTLKPFAHFFCACKNKREVFKKRKFEKMSKRLESETTFIKF